MDINFNKKANLFGENSNEDDLNEDELQLCNEENEDYLNEQYYNDTLFLIQNELIKYIEDKSLPICEYLSIDNLDSFISNYI
jgi:hypothetical protein